MLPFREVIYAKKIESGACFLAADIGGTNSNFGIMKPDGDSITLLLSLHVKSKEVTDMAEVIYDLIQYVQEKHGLTVTKACIGAAGVISENRDWAKPTNLTFEISAQKIEKKTGLPVVVLINDFEAVGFGIELLPKEDIMRIYNGTPRVYANKAVIGAGTGLGKGIMAWGEVRQTYIPVPSEGGHADFPVQNQHELDLISYIRESEKKTCNISWEDILSGDGIIRIYSFLGTINSYKKTRYTEEIEEGGRHPDTIFKYHKEDERCRDTFELFAKWYGRCAKDFALDALSLGGMYIAGGIAAKNKDLFTVPHFMREFINCGKQKKLLEQVPIYLILNYNVSLYGAAQYLMLRHR
jgi:glucokinase